MSLRSSRTSSGIRILMEVIGRTFCSRFFTRLLILIDFSLLRTSGPGGNDADGLFLTHKMDNKQKTGTFRVTDGSFTCFFLHTGINEAKERVEENLASFKECHSVLGKIARGFVGPIRKLGRLAPVGYPQDQCIYIAYTHQWEQQTS